MKKLIYLFGLLGLVAVFFIYGNYSSAIKYALNSSSEARVVVSIETGSSASKIADLLHSKDLISSPAAFNFYIKQNELSQDLKAGRIVLQENYTLPEIVEAIIEGKSQESAVTLLEGWTAKEIAEYLEGEGLTKTEDFLKCIEECEFDFNFIPEDHLEGYLYPDTYFVAFESFSDERFISRLIETLKNKLSTEDWTAINASNHSFAEIMTMASIVEREERVDSQKPTVAGILWNRFDGNAGLGADATVLYALGRTSGGLSYEDLQIDSPYNTRKYAGLPPTPISNPGIESIRAALYPTDTDYWYYLHDPEGGIHYASTLAGHNSNKARYLR